MRRTNGKSNHHARSILCDILSNLVTEFFIGGSYESTAIRSTDNPHPQRSFNVPAKARTVPGRKAAIHGPSTQI
jgi:hypothetical protein